MKKLLFLLLGILIALPATSRQLSPDEALLRLNNSSQSKGSKFRNLKFDTQYHLLKSISAPLSKEPAVYLFSKSDKSILVVSASTCVPALLGYFDNPNNLTSCDSLPDNLVYWLSEYAAQIQYAEENPDRVDIVPLNSSKQEIEPLIKTKWNQNAPYNLQCPVFSDKHAVTGCVATALAQVMNYYQWPERGKNSHTYQVFYSNIGRKEFSIDFSQIEFDWDAMLSEYNNDSDDRSKEAVAVLMKACGYSVNMQYDINTSGAQTNRIVNAAPEYFDYSDKAYYAERKNYSSPQWENLIYDQLSKSLPLIYSGRDGIGNDSTGHCFVCDGYDGNGYYHFNWGWGGFCDGFFLLSAITPSGVGIGGSANGYNVRQACIANFHPSTYDIDDTTGYIGSDLSVDNMSHQISINVKPEIASLAKSKMSFALEFTSENSDKYPLLELGYVSLNNNNIYCLNTKLSSEALYSIGLTDGDYEAEFVYKNNDNWIPLLYNSTSNSSVRITINGSVINLSIVEKTGPVKISNVRFNDSDVICKGTTNYLTYTATNESNDAVYWATSHYLIPVGNTPSKAYRSICNTNLALAPGETRTLTYPVSAQESDNISNGLYYLAVYADAEKTDIIYQDEDVIFKVEDPITDGRFLYKQIGKVNVELFGISSSATELQGDIIIPEKVIYNDIEYTVTSIGNFAFNGCSALTSATIPNTVTTINDNAFGNCSSLKELVIEDGNELLNLSRLWGPTQNIQTLYLGRNLSYFSGNGSISFSNLKSLTIGNSVTIIVDNAFYNCSALTSVSIGNSVASIGNYAFYNCGALKSVIIPDSVSTIGDYAFASCRGLTEVVISNYVTKIGEGSFRVCSALKSVIIPDSVSSIGDYAFKSCSSLTEVILPMHLEEIGQEVFAGCRVIKNIVFRGLTPVEGTMDDFDDSVYTNAILYVPKGCKTEFEAVNPWKLFRNISDAEYTKIQLDKSKVTLKEEETVQLEATVNPTSGEKVVWSSSDESVAVVSETGLVTAIKKGQAVITAKYGEATATCSITVEPKVGVDVIEAEEAIAYVYSLAGVMVLCNATDDDIKQLAPGIYIVRRGNVIEKIVVK